MFTFDRCPLQAGPKKPKQVPMINTDGHETWKMTVKWSSIRTFVQLQRNGPRTRRGERLRNADPHCRSGSLD